MLEKLPSLMLDAFASPIAFSRSSKDSHPAWRIVIRCKLHVSTLPAALLSTHPTSNNAKPRSHIRYSPPRHQSFHLVNNSTGVSPDSSRLIMVSFFIESTLEPSISKSKPSVLNTSSPRPIHSRIPVRSIPQPHLIFARQRRHRW